jgi:FMN-binding protein
MAVLMKRVPSVMVIALLAIVPSVVSAQSVPSGKIVASLERIFGRDIQSDSLSLPGAPIFRVSRSGTILGFAGLRNARGKDQPISYLVAVDTTLTLLDVDILVYREAYGGEIAYEAWRKQFRGKRPSDPLQVGRDIRGISGATISVNAVTLGVRQTLADFASRRQAGEL